MHAPAAVAAPHVQFFVMGFVDLVGIASNYAKADYQLTDTTANFLPSLVFFWFCFSACPQAYS